MAYQHVILDIDGDGIATLTLNRPDRLNASGQVMSGEIFAAIKEVSAGDARVLVLTGAGRAFCAGQDLKDAPEQSRFFQKRFMPRTGDDSFIAALRRMPQPTIASVNGPAMGMGLSMTLGCDLRIASEQALFGAAWAARGIPPEALGSYTLPQVVGLSKALEIIFMGKNLDGKQALEAGLANETVPHDQLAKRTREVALAIAKGPPVAHAMAKRAVYLGLRQDLETFAQYESLTLRTAFQTEDRDEGIRSFLEKREPKFTGQ